MNPSALTATKPIAVTLAFAWCVSLALPRAARCSDYPDPAPPEVHPLPADTPDSKPVPFDRLTFHQAPAPLATDADADADAVTGSWPHLLGPEYRFSTPERPLATRFPATGPPLVWEIERGPGHAAPVIAGDYLVFIHPAGPQSEAVECVHPETGRRYWAHEYDAKHISNYGVRDSARASPTIDGDYVYTLGIASHFHCFHLPTGRVIWKRDLAAELGAPHNFFGKGSSPLVYGDLVILNLGGRDNLSVAAFDKMTGRLRWGSRHPWGASYASPVPAVLHGKEHILVFAGGQSQPPHGGLLVIDPEDGAIRSATPWRSDMYASVNAASPVLAGENRVFITEAYTHGGAMIEVGADGSAKVAWSAPRFGSQFSTPILSGNLLCGFDGSSDPGATLVGYDAATGRELWRSHHLSLGRASLLAAPAAGVAFCVGEHGEFLSLKLSPQGATVVSEASLFRAPETFTPPVISRGLLYITQSHRDASSGTAPRILCYDLRGQ